MWNTSGVLRHSLIVARFTLSSHSSLCLWIHPAIHVVSVLLVTLLACDSKSEPCDACMVLWIESHFCQNYRNKNNMICLRRFYDIIFFGRFCFGKSSWDFFFIPDENDKRSDIYLRTFYAFWAVCTKIPLLWAASLIDTFVTQIDLHFFLQTDTAIGRNKSRDLFWPMTVSVSENKWGLICVSKGSIYENNCIFLCRVDHRHVASMKWPKINNTKKILQRKTFQQLITAVNVFGHRTRSNQTPGSCFNNFLQLFVWQLLSPAFYPLTNWFQYNPTDIDSVLFQTNRKSIIYRWLNPLIKRNLVS